MFFITTTDGDELVIRADAVLGFKAREGQAMFPEEQRGFDDNGPTIPPQSFHPNGLNRPLSLDRSVIG